MRTHNFNICRRGLFISHSCSSVYTNVNRTCIYLRLLCLSLCLKPKAGLELRVRVVLRGIRISTLFNG